MSLLYFHRITADRPPEGSVSPDYSNAVTENRFRQLLSSLHDRLCNWDECLDQDRFGEHPCDKVALSFDDGYARFADLVLPHIEAAGVRVIVFVTTSFANGDLVPYEYIVGELIRLKKALNIGSSRLRDCASPGEDWDIYRCLLSTMKRLSPRQRDNLISELLYDNGVEKRDLNLPEMLRWDQVRILSRHPLVDIGAHTKNHPHLPTLNTAEAWREIRESKTTIENEISAKVEAFAYPYGANTWRERWMLRAAGFRYGFATESGKKGAMGIHRFNAAVWTSPKRKSCGK